MRPALARRSRAWLLLATFVATLGLTGLSKDHLGIIDIACGAVNLTIGDRATAVGSASEGDAQHCPVCHFLRAVSGASTTAVARMATPVGLAAHVRIAIQVPPAVDRLTKPSRGPPTSTQPAVL
jgi:hypothetical protein